MAICMRAAIIGLAAVGLTVWLAGPATQAAAQEGERALTCTNPVSGTSWQIVIDYRRATVDNYPAAMNPATISWFDPKDGGNYTLDRKSGGLVGSVASSTGGYFRRGRCTPEAER